jgi:hypothetical protein
MTDSSAAGGPGTARGKAGGRKRVTIISAPAGSGKVSLLRAWAGRSRQDRRIDTSAPKATVCETGNSSSRACTA